MKLKLFTKEEAKKCIIIYSANAIFMFVLALVVGYYAAVTMITILWAVFFMCLISYYASITIIIILYAILEIKRGHICYGL